MSIRRWLVLWLLFMGYLFLGAFIFFKIERDLEEKRRYERYYEQREIQFFLQENCVSLTDINKREKMSHVIAKVSNYCGKPFSRVISNSTHDEPYVWTFYNSFFFALTTLSTIGYGNLSPTSEEGKICVILYALVGIPFNGIVLTHLGDFFGSKFLRAHHRYKNQFYETRITLILDILIYLIPGIGVFILVPSVVFQHFEEWTFVESIYYSFVSLTTIGYGDFVAGQETNGTFSHVCYKIFLIFWIMFGLGYLVMILGFISRAMRSKQINKLERKVTQTLKQTQSRIWHEFVQDIQYLRRALNELYLLKVKPVYKEKLLYSGLHLSHSCPNLTEWPVLRPKGFEFEAKKDIPMRRRAFSEDIPEEKLFRVLSDGALKDIDRQATFPTGLEPGYLINSVADAFGPGSPHESDSDDYKEDGVHGFSDEEILATEDYTGAKESTNTTWMLGGAPLRRAGRAMSDAQFTGTMLGPQKTWSGVDSLHQFALLKAMRAKGNEPLINEEKSEKLKESSPPASPARSLRRFSAAAINFFTPVSKIKKKSLEEIKERENEQGKERKRRSCGQHKGKLHRLSLQEEQDNDIYDELNYFSQTTGRRPSILDILASTQNNQSNTISPVLEQTSIADFIRVVNSLKAIEKSRSNTPPLNSIFARPYCSGKKRNLSSGGPNTPERRFSQVPNLGLTTEGGVFRRRAASITPVTSPRIDRRLKRFSTSTRLTVPSGRSSGRVTPTLPPAPSVVVTSPDGSHKFSVQNVAETRRKDSLWEVITRP